MKQENEAGRGAGAGEVFVKCIEKTGFPGLGFSRQGGIAAWASQRRSREGKLHFEGSRSGGWVYTKKKRRESKMEIPAYRSFGALGTEMLKTGRSP
jgi:hypothetical protein